jgi:putative FmdB family regulatory protein
MPIYEYECPKCGHRQEENFTWVTAHGIEKGAFVVNCRKCQCATEKIISLTSKPVIR